MAKLTGVPKQSGTVSYMRDSVEYRGVFVIFGGTITVTYDARQKSTQLGGSAAAPAALARVLLSELVTEQLARPKR
jgi:hypothetical protein